MKRNLWVGATFCAMLGALAVGSVQFGKRAVVHAATVMAPRFEVDPLWPKPLPNHWLLGQTIGVSVDAQDHIWIIHRAGSLEPGELHASKATIGRTRTMASRSTTKATCGLEATAVVRSPRLVAAAVARRAMMKASRATLSNLSPITWC
jgi:hypothetical protein